MGALFLSSRSMERFVPLNQWLHLIEAQVDQRRIMVTILTLKPAANHGNYGYHDNRNPIVKA